MARTRNMMWANYRRGNGLAVPAPFDDMSANYWWYDRIGMLAQGLANHGFTDLLFPSMVKTQSGPYKTGDGYGVFDHYDLGDKNQCGGIPTRFGYVEQARRAIAIARANGIDVMADIIMHQCIGGRNGEYVYKSSTGNTNGRFPKYKSYFRGDTSKGYAPQDPVVSPADDFSFGDELSPVMSQPKGELITQLLLWGDWFFRTTGMQGARIDDTKGTALAFLNPWVSYGIMNKLRFFAEHATGNNNDLAWFLSQVHRDMSVIDFGFHYEMAMPMTLNGDRANWQASWVIGKGFVAHNPMHAIPFVESMDSDTNGFATIVFNKILAYAFMFGVEGCPMSYIRDYLREQDCYGLEPAINNLAWCHQMLANGPTSWRFSDANVLAFERTGAPGLLVTLNKDVFNPNWHTINVQTNFGANVRLHDFTGHDGTDRWTDWQGRVTLGVPPGADGKGYGMWSRSTMAGEPYIPTQQTWCEQTFYGAHDLAIAPAGWQHKTQQVAAVWCDRDTPFTARLHVPNDSAKLTIIDPDGVARDLPYANGSEIGIDKIGWHTVNIDLPSEDDAQDYFCNIRYRATQTLTVEQVEADKTRFK